MAGDLQRAHEQILPDVAHLAAGCQDPVPSAEQRMEEPGDAEQVDLDRVSYLVQRAAEPLLSLIRRVALAKLLDHVNILARGGIEISRAPFTA